MKKKKIRRKTFPQTSKLNLSTHLSDDGSSTTYFFFQRWLSFRSEVQFFFSEVPRQIVLKRQMGQCVKGGKVGGEQMLTNSPTPRTKRKSVLQTVTRWLHYFEVP